MPVPCITILSDDKYSLEAMSLGLQEVGFHARAYNNLRSGLQASLSSPPSLVIIDMDLDDLQYRKLLGFLRQKDKLQAVPLIVIADIRRRLPAIGTADERLAILTKPLTLGTLLSSMRRLLLDGAVGRSPGKSAEPMGQRVFHPSRKTEIGSPGSEPYSTSHAGSSDVPKSIAPMSPQGADACSATILPPRIHSINARWIEEELEITVNGCHFVSAQEMREALSIGIAGSTQIILDGIVIPTLFFSSSQLKARIPAGQLVGRRQCTLQVAHPASASASTPGMVITLPPIPPVTVDHSAQPDLARVTPNELASDCSDLTLIVEDRHISQTTKA